MKIKIRSIPIVIISFIVMVSLTISAGYYKKALASETSKFKITINGDGVGTNRNIIKPIVININEQGLPKKLVQPTRISVSGVIENKGKESLSIQLVNKGFDGQVISSSKNNKFDNDLGIFKEELKSKKTISISLLIDVAKDNIKQYQVSTGIINIVNLKNKTIVGTIPFKIINSSVQGLDNDETLKCLEEESCD